MYMGGVKVREMSFTCKPFNRSKVSSSVSVCRFVSPLGWFSVCPRQSSRTSLWLRLCSARSSASFFFNSFQILYYVLSAPCCRPASVQGVAPCWISLDGTVVSKQTKQKPFTITLGPPSFFLFLLERVFFKWILTAFWNSTHLVLIPA